MAELTGSPSDATAASCCSAAARASCCESSEKEVCCGEAETGTCGCSAGAAAPPPEVEGDIRETVEIEVRPTHRVHEHASAAIIRARKP